MTRQVINPFWILLPANYNLDIPERTEAELLVMGPARWRPVVVKDRVLIDGLVRVLVARKHGIVEIPCIHG